MNVLELFAGVGGFRIGLEMLTQIISKHYGATNGSLLESLKMLSRYIIIIFQTVKILILVLLTLQMSSLLKWMLR